MQEHARALAEQRARRAQYLPAEDVDSEEEWEYNQLGPRQQAYLEAKRRQAMLEQRQRAEQLERQRVLEEQKWQEDLERKQREDEEHRRKLLDERKRESRLKREEDALQEERERVSGLVPSQNGGLMTDYCRKPERPRLLHRERLPPPHMRTNQSPCSPLYNCNKKPRRRRRHSHQ